jgi:hypothetical protein
MTQQKSFANPRSAADLVGRDAHLAQVVSVLAGGGGLAIIGPQGYGKTTLLTAAMAAATEEVAPVSPAAKGEPASGDTAGKRRSTARKGNAPVVVLADVELFPALSGLAEYLLATTLRALDPAEEKAQARATKTLGAWRPFLSRDAITGVWTAELHGATGEASQRAHAVCDVLDYLAAVASDLKRPAAVVLDEADLLLGSSAEVERRLAATRKTYPAFGLVLTSSWLPGLAERMSSTRFMPPLAAVFQSHREVEGSHPLRTHLELIELTAPAWEESVKYLQQGFRRARLGLPDDVGHLLVDTAEDVPSVAYPLADLCVRILRETATKKATAGTVMAAQERLLKERESYFRERWRALTPHQQRGALMVAWERGDNPRYLSARVCGQYGIAVGTMQKALTSFEASAMCRFEQLAGNQTPRARFADPLFALWIRTVVPRGAFAPAATAQP